MKLTSYLIASTIALFLVFGGCGKDPEYKSNTYTFTGKLDSNCSFSQKGYACYEKIGNVKLEFFANKTDLLAGKNVIHTYYTNAEGVVNYKNNNYFIKASKDGLNNLRMYYDSFLDKKIFDNLKANEWGISCDVNSGSPSKCLPEQPKVENTFDKVIILGSTPCKLNIQAFQNGVKLNKKIKLYLSETDRDSKRVYKATDVELANMLFPSEYNDRIMTDIYEQGEITFVWLEPRKYWITVDDKIPTPASTYGPLKDDPNITTSLQVAVP